jgi:endoglucanase
MRFRRNFLYSLAYLLLPALPVVINGCGNGVAPSSPSSTTHPQLPGQVSIINNRLVRDGKPWVSHGFFQVAFQTSPNELNVPAFETEATDNYTPQEYSDMVTAGADSVRVMLGQTVGDQENTQYYSAALVAQFIQAVQDARKAGLTVIVSIQDESIVQDPNPTPLPNDATRRVWSKLVPAFKDDKGILLELLNEPGTGPDQVVLSSDWQDWAAAMNSTIASVRSEGATNVVVAGGLAHAETLSGAPALTDPLNQVAYAAHPYAFNADQEKPSFWDASFGTFAQTAPVIVTEWGQGYYCGTTNPTALISFLQYIQNKGIGLEMSFWDWGGPTAFGGTRYDFPTPLTSTYYRDNGTPLECGQPERGPGKTINSWYATGVIPATPL